MPAVEVRRAYIHRCQTKHGRWRCRSLSCTVQERVHHTHVLSWSFHIFVLYFGRTALSSTTFFFLQMTNSNNALDWLSNTIKRTPCKCRIEALQRMVPSDGWISYFASSVCFLSLRMSTASIHPPVQYGDAGPRIVQHMGKEAPFYASLRTRTPVLKWHDLNTSPQHTILQRSFASLAINALRSVRKPFVLAS